jgi:hypothetical protein
VLAALLGESKLETAGLGGSFRLGKVAAPIGGADIGICAVNGLGGTGAAADAGGDGLLLAVEVAGDCSSLVASVFSLASVAEADSGVVSPDPIAGELSDIAFVRKSV